MTRRRFLASMISCPLFAGCSDNAAAVEPIWGKQACAHCAMVLSDRRFGAQLLTPGGDRLFFDDAGCLVLFLEEQRTPPTRAWVRDADGERWLDIHAAFYAVGAISPMGFGFEARAADGIPWAVMRARVLERARKGS